MNLLIFEFGFRLFSFIKDSQNNYYRYDEFDKKTFYQYDGDLGWKLIPDSFLHQIFKDFSVDYKTNKQSFRNDKNFNLNKPINKKIAIFGDSFIFGVGV